MCPLISQALGYVITQTSLTPPSWKRRNQSDLIIVDFSKILLTYKSCKKNKNDNRT